MTKQEWKQWWREERSIAKMKALRFVREHPEASVARIPIFLPIYPRKAEYGCNILLVHITTLDFDVWRTFEVWRDERGEELTLNCRKRKEVTDANKAL